MKRWWMSLALVGWLGWAAFLPAQPFMPSPDGSAGLPDPTPTARSTVNDKLPPLIDGPMNPRIAPPGPPDSLSLSESHPSAFQAEIPGADCGIFFHIGPMALWRQNLGSSTVAYQDFTGPPSNNPLSLPPNQVGGAVLGFDSISQPLRWGLQGTIGYFWNGQSIEARFWGIFQSTNSRTAAQPFGLYSFFENPPTGFPNSLWLEADSMTLSYTWSMFNGEFNYRYASEAVSECEIILGTRWVDFRERLAMTTVENQFGGPTDVATYAVSTRNNLVAPQIGLEYAKHLKWITFGLTAKAAVGVNFASVNTSLIRGDGLLGFSNQRSEMTPGAGIYDLCAWVDFNVLERMHIHAGYTGMWLTGMSLAVDQFEYNLGNPAGRINTSGSVFFHGPMLEFQFLF